MNAGTEGLIANVFQNRKCVVKISLCKLYFDVTEIE